MRDDAELLCCYAQKRSEAAFAELVGRHVNLVYRAALRQLGGDAHLAEDVAQLVFTLLARKAGPLSRHPSLSGWLYTTTNFTVSQVRRAEHRRRMREQEAQAMHEFASSSGPATDWARLRPVIDAAMQELNALDREALLLRFFGDRPFGEIGGKLRVTDDAARMRVERALDRLRARLARRGIGSSAAALALMLTGEAGVAAPAGLSSLVTSAVLSGATTSLTTAGGMTLALKISHFMSTTKITTATTTAMALLAVTVAVYQTGRARSATASVDREQTEQRAKIEGLQKRLRTERENSAAADADSAALLKAMHNLATGESSGQVPAAPTVPLTNETVNARYARAQEMARNGQYEEAFKEYLWCYDEGMPTVGTFSGLRNVILLEFMENYGAQYPAAAEAVRARRDRAEQRMFANSADGDAPAEYATLNLALKDGARTLALYDELPVDDPRRRPMKVYLSEPLLAAQRYADAAQARPYAQMIVMFEMATAKEGIKKSAQDGILKTAATDIEILAGAGDLPHARTLTDRVLAYERSDETKALLQQHATRAGHPELLAPAAKP